MSSSPPAPPRSAYAGLFCTALATLMFEILLTRIFSATTWYHFAFMAISVAMFGMTAGALFVYLRPKTFVVEAAPRQMARSTLAFAVSIPLAFLAHLCIPLEEHATVVAIFGFALTYVVVTIPFFFSGIAVCLALTKYPTRISALYGADLAGAGLGCIALLWTLRYTDGPTAVLAIAAVAALGGWLFSLGGGRGAPRFIGLLITAGLGFLAWGHGALARDQEPPIRLAWVKGQRESPVVWERWNSFSRVTVKEYENGNPARPFGWGMSPKAPQDQLVRQKGLFIDGVAGTVITEFDGDAEKLSFLKWDVTNMAHWLRPDAKVLIVGTGGGRDVLSALAFDQREVVGVEMNQDVLGAMTKRFGDFAGHLDQHPKVRLINDEARSWVSRTEENFDVLQISLIDTWAATTAGAFVLAENALYTVEAWDTFLDHLTDRGVVTVSRWYGGWAAELWRMTSVAVAALEARGVTDPMRHLAVVRSAVVGNLIVGREPLTEADLTKLRTETERMGFKVLLAGGETEDPVLHALARGEEPPPLEGGLQLDLSPPTDNRPFFFNMLRLEDVLDPEVRNRPALDANLKAVVILGILLAIVATLTFLCVVVPLLLTADRSVLRGSFPLLLFFASIGFGFLLVELSQMHRLVLFLGHPTYGLSVVLFALLLSSGIGSLLSQRFTDGLSAGPKVLGILILLLAGFALATPVIADLAEAWPTWARITTAVVLLFPLGVPMGMAFPLGLRLAAAKSEQLTPWLWGVNGATSVCASVLATALALSFSISTAFWAGVGCYVVAWLAFLWARRGATRLA
ncbi:MAG: hypothetical protein AAF628_09200 [Planctomycetota bacterium]